MLGEIGFGIIDNGVLIGFSLEDIINNYLEYILDDPKDDMIEGKDWQWVEKGEYGKY